MLDTRSIADRLREATEAAHAAVTSGTRLRSSSDAELSAIIYRDLLCCGDDMAAKTINHLVRNLTPLDRVRLLAEVRLAPQVREVLISAS